MLEVLLAGIVDSIRGGSFSVACALARAGANSPALGHALAAGFRLREVLDTN